MRDKSGTGVEMLDWKYAETSAWVEMAFQNEVDAAV